MLLDLVSLSKQYNLSYEGVIQAGAHYGQEQSIYDELDIPIENRHYFEPQKKVFEILRENIGSRGHTYNFALGNTTGEMEMFSSPDNESMSNSLLEPEIHKYQYPHIRFTDRETVMVYRLDDIWSCSLLNKKWLINLDVQGYELEVLKGMQKVLPYTVAVLTEVNRDEVYKGCARVEEIDEFLGKYGFQRRETNFLGISWGDALYTKGK